METPKANKITPVKRKLLRLYSKFRRHPAHKHVKRIVASTSDEFMIALFVVLVHKMIG